MCKLMVISGCGTKKTILKELKEALPNTCETWKFEVTKLLGESVAEQT